MLNWNKSRSYVFAGKSKNYLNKNTEAEMIFLIDIRFNYE